MGGMKNHTRHKATLTTIGVALALLITGCAPSAMNESTVNESTVSGDTGAADLEAPENETPESESPLPAQADTPTPAALPDWTIGAPPEGTDAFLAWEALMGPGGEYAALASYQAVLDEFGQAEPYASIKDAEARHADALARQLERMGVEVPENPYLGLIATPVDLESAAIAWAEGEVANVELYDALIAETEDSRLARVFENLRRASAEEHLPAFELAADNGGSLDPRQMAQLRD